MNNHPSPHQEEELPVLSQMKAFARLILPIYENEYQRQLMAKEPCWTFLACLEHRMRELEEQAK